jgi:hypothetical protein
MTEKKPVENRNVDLLEFEWMELDQVMEENKRGAHQVFKYLQQVGANLPDAPDPAIDVFCQSMPFKRCIEYSMWEVITEEMRPVSKL